MKFFERVIEGLFNFERGPNIEAIVFVFVAAIILIIAATIYLRIRDKRDK